MSYIPRTVHTGVDSRELTYTSQLVADLGGRPLAVNEPMVGRYTFAHGAGIHQDGVNDDPETYECLRAKDYGQIAGEIIVGNLSGNTGVSNRLKAIGIKPTHEELRAITMAAKDFSTKQGRDRADTDIEMLMADIRGNEIIDSVAVQNIHKVDDSALSEITLLDQGKTITLSADLREDAIDTAIKAINAGLAFDGKVRDWHGDALGEGSDAGANAYIDVVHKGRPIKAYAEGDNVVYAAINAYTAAISLLRRVEERLES